MAKIAIIGAGFAGHTAALYLGDQLGKKHDVTMINKQDYFLYVPSLIWLGVGHMKEDKVRFPLKPVYDKMHVNFVHGAAAEVHPDEQFVTAVKQDGTSVQVDYDYLIIATGPKLDFEATSGLGPAMKNTFSLCNAPHAAECRNEYLENIARMEKGEKRKLLIGTGHPGATCQGAALEYISNIHKDLLNRGIRDKAELHWLSNEAALGDFGVRGLRVQQKGTTFTSEEFISAIFDDYQIKWEVQKGVHQVEKDRVHWEDYDGNYGETAYDFAMLIPAFKGQPFKYVNKEGEDITAKLNNPGGFFLVDGKYGLPYPELAQTPEAWPSKYQNPTYPNMFAAGIAFAPPGPISKPFTNKNGLLIAPAPPRTGMISGAIGRVVAMNVADLIEKGEITHGERMTEMVAACIASMGDSLWDGNAVTIVMRPVVPDRKKYNNPYGRDLFVSHLEMGLSGAWMKYMLHYTFMWKFKGKFGWKLIPE